MAAIEEKKNTKVSKKSVTKKTDHIEAADNADVACKILVEPWITEKTHGAIADDRYTFKITKGSTKKQVKTAIEGIYGVKVEKVTMINIKPKPKAYGRHWAIKSGIRKATVTLKKGDKIELFQGA